MYKTSSNAVNANDAWQVNLLSKNLKEGSFYLDIGAHCGQYTILMAALCGHSGRVIAFEPDPHARKVLQKKIVLNRQLKTPILEEYACSDAVGSASVFSKQGSSQSSLARSAVEFDDTSVEAMHVQATTVDHYLKTNNFTSMPDWVEIDAEGAEIRILK